MLQMQPNFLSSIMGGSPEIDQGPMDLSSILQGANTGQMAPGIQAAGQAPASQDAPTGRRSILDIIGGLGDVFAKVGGAEAQYRPQVDARQDRARQVDLDAMRHQQFDLQQRQGEQSLQSGALDLDEKQHAVLGQATRGLAAVYQKGGAPALAKAWPMLSQQLGIHPDQASIFGQALTTDPEGTLTALNAALNPPTNAGSAPREVQLYNLAKQENPDLKFDDFLRTMQEKPMTEYQQAQVGLGGRRQTLAERRAAQAEAWLTDPRNPKNRAKPVKGAADPAATAAGLRDLQGVLGDIRGNYENLRRDGAMVRQGGAPGKNIVAAARASGLGQAVEGYTGSNAQTYRDNIKTSRPALVQAIAKATGMSSKQLDSNADMKLALSQATDPSMSYETNQAALARLERFAANHNRTASAPAPSGGNRGPAARPRPAGKLSPRGGPTVSNW